MKLGIKDGRKFKYYETWREVQIELNRIKARLCWFSVNDRETRECQKLATDTEIAIDNIIREFPA